MKFQFPPKFINQKLSLINVNLWQKKTPNAQYFKWFNPSIQKVAVNFLNPQSNYKLHYDNTETIVIKKCLTHEIGNDADDQCKVSGWSIFQHAHTNRSTL